MCASIHLCEGVCVSESVNGYLVCVGMHDFGLTLNTFKGVPMVEFLYLGFTCTPGELL